MKNEFIPYEQALELKQLGFDEPCFGYYDGNHNLQYMFNGKSEKFTERKMCVSDSVRTEWISAPTFSQAFIWFRKKYFLHSYISCSCTVNEILSYDWIIHKIMNTGTREENFITDYERTYEDAELECLKRLIEIIRNHLMY